MGCAGSFPSAGVRGVRLSRARPTTTPVAPGGSSLDLGNGALGALQNHCDPADVDAFAISHMHADHCADLVVLGVYLRYRPAGSGAGRCRSTRRPARPSDSPRWPARTRRRSLDGCLDVRDLVAGRARRRRAAASRARCRCTTRCPAFGIRIDRAVRATTRRARSPSPTPATPTSAPVSTRSRPTPTCCCARPAFLEGRDDALRGIHLTGRRAGQVAAPHGTRRLRAHPPRRLERPGRDRRRGPGGLRRSARGGPSGRGVPALIRRASMGPSMPDRVRRVCEARDARVATDRLGPMTTPTTAALTRADGRRPDELRPVTLTRRWLDTGEGSVLVEFGGTKVLCVASFTPGVPRWRKGSGEGWVTAEYAMLPRATNTRSDRESVKGRIGGRTHEISRLIGRSLRAVVDVAALGENTLVLDCDVLQADGGTRTAAITGAWVALADAIAWGQRQGAIKGARPVLLDSVAAVSVGHRRRRPGPRPALRRGRARAHRHERRRHRQGAVRRGPGHRRAGAVRPSRARRAARPRPAGDGRAHPSAGAGAAERHPARPEREPA